MISLHPEVHAQQLIEALSKQSGADQKYDGGGEFYDDELGPETAPQYSG